ncbi:response regulator [Actinomadura parmotrematis]|uniref:Response regulator transcription factor n=1 Tax=Actinomadura parmotrematis TaxID=2864039 RepID=A0ABS7G4R7_9ACTN|nr:response regulator transcription factor [Actinomadura parmotrematis]MBW8487730.1 response regulator transcription factor [Actinomadura parmotrematis]
MIRVVLADDEAMIRAGVRAILASDPSIAVVAEAGDGHEAVRAVLAHRPDVVLMDIRMPRLDGLEALAELRRAAAPAGLDPGQGPQDAGGPAVVMLTTFGEDDYIAQALAGGASGFLLKSGDPHELLAGVRAAAAGAAFLSPRVAHRVIGVLAGGRLAGAASARRRAEALTPRERQVLGLLGQGLSNAEIAGRLHVVEGTVKAYVSMILTRLQVRNRVQAAIVAHEAGLIAGPPD